MRPRPRHVFAWAATLFVLTAQFFRFPSPLRDLDGRFLDEFQLLLPWGYLLTMPFSAVADMVTFNSARQDAVLIAYLLLGYWLWRWYRDRPIKVFYPKESLGSKTLHEIVSYAVYLLGVAAFLSWAMLLSRPAAKLLSSHPDDLIVDFHSHTKHSWDGRKSFTPEKNMAWHRKTGFHAAFITDHNKIEGAQAAAELSKRNKDGFKALMGEELSLFDSHIAVLGNKTFIDPKHYGNGLDGVYRLLSEAQKYGGSAIMSSPEFWAKHPQKRWEEFAKAGALGFEVVNAAPKGLDFPPALKQELILLCKKRNLALLGATDNHGWGWAAYVWNATRIKGHQFMDAAKLERAVMEKLRKDRFSAVRIVTRVKREPQSGVRLCLDPFEGLWTTARTFTFVQVLLCIFWFWLPGLLRDLSREIFD